MYETKTYRQVFTTTRHLGLWFCRFSGSALWPRVRDPVPEGAAANIMVRQNIENKRFNIL